MRKTLWLVLTLLILLMITSNCGCQRSKDEKPTAGAANSTNEQSLLPAKAGRIIFLIIDTTDSFRPWLEDAKEKIVELIKKFTLGDYVFLVPISRNSFRNAVEYPFAKSGGMFQVEAQKTRRRLIKEVRKITINPESGTDILSALYAVQRYQANHPDLQRYVFIFSDLEDTFAKNVGQLTLADDEITCLFVAHPEGEVKLWESKVKSWENYFRGTGCRSVIIYDPTESRNLKLLP